MHEPSKGMAALSFLPWQNTCGFPKQPPRNPNSFSTWLKQRDTFAAGPGSRYSSNSREACDETLNERTRRPSWETPPGIKNDPYSSRAARPPDFAQEDVQGGKNRKNKNGATARTTSRSRTTREQTTLL